MANILITVVAVYVVALLALSVFQRQLLYHPSSERPQLGPAGVPEMAERHLLTEDGLTLNSWYAPAKSGYSTVVYFHGNAGHIGNRSHKARSLLDAGLGVLLVGYRGFGGNPGRPTEEGLYADARAALMFLANEGLSPDRIVLYGESLGSGVAVHTARDMAEKGALAGAVVLEAPFSSIPDVAGTHYPFMPVRLLVRDRYDSIAKIRGIRSPLLIVHGDSDPTVPQRFGRRLFEAASEPKEGVWIAGAHHNDLADFGLFQRVTAFVAQWLGPNAS